MHHHNDFPYEWNVTARVGPMLFNIIINHAFFNYSTNQSSEMHRHATSELHFITEGAGILSTDDKQYDISPGCYYLIQSGVSHKQKGEVDSPVHRYCCRFEYELADNSDAEYSEEEIQRFVYILSSTPFFYSRNFNAIKPLFYEIQSELLHKPFGYYTKVKYLFSLLFTDIIREIAMDSRFGFVSHPPETHLENRISIIENFFDLNDDYKPTANDLCELLHISTSQLNRILKKKYNMTFKQKHIERQIESSKHLLANSDLPIRAVAEKMGYTSEGNFTAFFKRETGASPKVFRKQSRISSDSSPNPSSNPSSNPSPNS